MKPHPELTTAGIIKAFREQQGGTRRHQPMHEGDPFDRAPDQEEIEETAHIQEMIAEKGDAVFRTLCIGCDQDVAITDSTPCACGGFVCASCRESEEEGVCNHEPPDYDAPI